MAHRLKSVFLCTGAVLPGRRGVVGVHHNASKAGLEGLTRGYAARLVKDGTTVNAVAPSLIETDMTRAYREDVTTKVPLGRLGTPDEVGQAVLMVVGNGCTTGQTIAVNGGRHFN